MLAYKNAMLICSRHHSHIFDWHLQAKATTIREDLRYTVHMNNYDFEANTWNADQAHRAYCVRNDISETVEDFIKIFLA